MTQPFPPFAVFPDLNCILRTPSGTEYRGKLRQHPSTETEDEHWYEGFLRAQLKDHVTADTTLKDRFTRDGLRPAYFHPELQCRAAPHQAEPHSRCQAQREKFWNACCRSMEP